MPRVACRSGIAKALAIALTAGLALTLGGCSWRNPDLDPAQAHHRPEGFVNSDGSRNDKPFSALLSWSWQRWRAGLPKPPSSFVDGYAGFPLATPAPARPRAEPGAPMVTWIGHATVLLQMGGLNILTDPQFSERAFAVQWFGPKRKVPLPMMLEQLPPIDIVVISHSHYDHLDRNSVVALAARDNPPEFLVPLGLLPWFRDLGIERVRAFDWWQSTMIGAVEASFVPAHHWSARSLFDRNRTLWGGWVFRTPAFAAYFAGDTGYSQDFAEISRRFGGFDLALIPVGAYEPRWFMADYHVDPAEAVRIHRDVGSNYSIGIHWGSFELTDESLDAPIEALARALDAQGLARNEFELLRHGETRRLKPRKEFAR